MGDNGPSIKDIVHEARRSSLVPRIRESSTEHYNQLLRLQNHHKALDKGIFVNGTLLLSLIIIFIYTFNFIYLIFQNNFIYLIFLLIAIYSLIKRYKLDASEDNLGRELLLWRAIIFSSFAFSMLTFNIIFGYYIFGFLDHFIYWTPIIPPSILLLCHYGYHHKRLQKYEASLFDDFEAHQENVNNKQNKNTETILTTMDEIKEQSYTTGNIIIDGNENTVVIGPGTVEIIRGKKNTNPDLASSLTTVLGHIENLNNTNAAKYFDSFTKEVDRENPDKTTLELLWDSIVSAAPTVKTLSDAVKTITSLF